MQSERRRLLGRLAMLGPIAFTIAWIVAGITEDDYSVRQEDISALAAIDAQYPLIMITGFLLLALGCVALAVGLASAIAGWSARIGSVLLIIAGLGVAVAGTGAQRLQQRAPSLCCPSRGWDRLLAPRTCTPS
jgi:hypothetical membrane protein